MIHKTINLLDYNFDMQQLSGVENKNLIDIEKEYDVSLVYKNNELVIKGLIEENVEKCVRFFELTSEVIGTYGAFDEQDIRTIFNLIRTNKSIQFKDMLDEVITRTFSGKPIRPKTFGQKIFVDDIKTHDLTFAIGPAGTGKTFLAVCHAVELLKKNEIQKIILTRPAVEAGENLGFLPGDLKEKVEPYLRPLYDALDDLLSPERVQRYLEKGVIEIAPLAYMRGRTLDDAMIILDEAQNTTRSQMMMFLSRLGKNSKMIVTGDIDQVDLPKHQQSGLKVANDILQDIPKISFVHLNHSDVVRHPLVIEILKRFSEGNLNEKENSNHRR